MRKLVDAFLSMHNFPVRLNVSAVTDAVLYDMEAGLCKKGIAAGEEMIHTFALPPEKKPANENVIVIDAGGTNFRSCLVTFDSNGKPSISEMEKTSMPGVAKELSKKEFFDQFATNLEHLKNKATKIGFCFSYPMQITADGDGILNGFSKEVKAPEVVGCKIGECLSEALVAHGWKRPEKISLINDTVAALLAGASRSGTGFDYSSYIGFILGTGMNIAYIQPETDYMKSQIVVCESGKFNKLVDSDFDRELDSHTTAPGTFRLEKKCSGAYLGTVAYYIIKAACEEGLFSESVAKALSTLNSLTLIDMDKFLHAPLCTETPLGKLLGDAKASADDYTTLFMLFDAVVERSARYSAAILAAAVIKSGQGKDPVRPVCIVCNGTTFYKTHAIRDRVAGYLEEILTAQHSLYFHLVSVDDDITVGTAISGLV